MKCNVCSIGVHSVYNRGTVTSDSCLLYANPVQPMNSPNLWGKLPPAGKQHSPKEILADQAQMLTRHSKGRLTGSVRTLQPTTSRVECDLEIRVPALGNYRFDVLRIAFPPLSRYPVSVADYGDVPHTTAATEKEYHAALKAILRSDRVREALAAMLQHAEPAAADGASDPSDPNRNGDPPREIDEDDLADIPF